LAVEQPEKLNKTMSRPVLDTDEMNVASVRGYMQDSARAYVRNVASVRGYMQDSARAYVRENTH
jgi:hypothetical protein